MVRNKKIWRLAVMTCLSLTLLISGCKRGDSPFNPPERTEGADEESEEIADSQKGDEESFFDQDLFDKKKDDGSGIVVQGPEIPPEGQRYDEWKGFEYSDETSFPVRTYWAVAAYDGRSGSAAGLYQDPEHIEDGVLEIIDAKAEPVGGEMKLRSGGYVDITIETRWTGTMTFKTQDEFNAYGCQIAWGDNELIPCDAYTGTSLLNYVDDEHSDNDSIGIGEAYDTGMVESDITWNGRTYRLFAKSDKRNASFDSSSYDYYGGYTYVTEPGAVETTYTLRVPADYDGMVLAIDKDITDEKADHLASTAEFLENSDTYADILTTDTGVKQSADGFYFIKVSDLLEKFSSSQST